MNRPGQHGKRLGMFAGFLTCLAPLGCLDANRDANWRPARIARGTPPAETKPTETKSAETKLAPPAELPKLDLTPQLVPAQQTVAVSLDAVLRLAEEQNHQIAIAREKVCLAFAEQDLAAKKWIPDIYAGFAYYRHEGGIQLQEGPLIHSSTGAFLAGGEIAARLDLGRTAYFQIDAARKRIQAQGELKKITFETVLDASSTYIDLLAAQSSIAILTAFDRELEKLLTEAQKSAKIVKLLEIEVIRLQAERVTQGQLIRTLRLQAASAAQKLAYLLGIEQCNRIQPLDTVLTPLNLIAAEQPLDALMATALSRGPGVKELQELIALITDAAAKADGAVKYVPVISATLGEGAFGAGPGASSRWDNRFDLGLQVRWNLTDHLMADTKRRIAQSQSCQVQLTYQELRAKLALGVAQAREAVLTGQELNHSSEELITQAQRAKEFVDKLREDTLLKDNPFDTLRNAARAVAAAQLNYVDKLREYDKAQLRLLILLGGNCNTAGRP